MCDVCVVEGEINFWPGFSVVSFFFFLFVNGIFTKEGNIYLLLGTFLSQIFFRENCGFLHTCPGRFKF